MELSPRVPWPALVISATQLLAASLALAQTNYEPTQYGVGSAPMIDGLHKYSQSPIILKPSSHVATLDYGYEVGGWPFIELDSASSFPVEVQLTYSEPYDGLNQPYGDGPWLFAVGLMSSFRTDTFNITKPGRTEAPLLQGGLRWQTIRVLSPNASVTIKSAGIRPSVHVTSATDLSGGFETSDAAYGSVWALGATAVQAACIDKKSQPSTWDISSRDGAFIRGQFPAVSALTTEFANYTLTFATKIAQGGTGWRVVGGANDGYGAYFVITSSEPTLSTFNVTSLPRNTLTAGYGFSIINQEILGSAPTRSYDLHMTVKNDEWYSITTKINGTGFSISINDHEIAFVTAAEWQPYINTGWGPPTLQQGAFGFGPFLNQEAWFKDVEAVAQNGTKIYHNSLKSSCVLGEYSVASNQHSVCLDGAKRDRAIWIGDFVHTARIIAASTGRFDYVSSMVAMTLDWQLDESSPGHGLVPIQSYPGLTKQYRDAFYPLQYAEADYQFFFLLILGDYFAITEDTTLLGKYWDNVKLLVATLVDRYLDPSSGLMTTKDGFSWFTAQGFQNATAPTALFAVCMQELAVVADALSDKESKALYEGYATNLTHTINSKVWSDKLGTYAISLNDEAHSSMLATAFAIRAGMPNATQATSAVQKLSELFLNIGYKDSTAIGDGDHTQLSPNTQGFLFESLFLASLKLGVSADVVVPVIRILAEEYWPKMFNQNQYNTGASWEYVYADGSPGIGLFTSLSHPWGGAPTYVYTNYILGVRRELDGETGKFQWVFSPAWDIVEGLGLTQAKGRVPLPGGGYIKASWKYNKGVKETNITVIKSYIQVSDRSRN